MTRNHPLLQKIVAQLRQEKSLTDAIFDGIPGIIYLFDDGWRAVRWNRKFREVTGYSDAELSAMSCLNFFRGAEQELIRQRVEQTMQIGYSESEADLYHKDGTCSTFYLTATALMIGNKPHFAGIGIDISERRRAVEALALSEAELRRRKNELERAVEVRTAEVVAANQELTALNQEMNAMNEDLQHANSQLGAEIELRRLKEDELLLRERQYRSATRLLTRPVEETAPGLEAILRDALQLVKAPAGYIGLYN